MREAAVRFVFLGLGIVVTAGAMAFIDLSRTTTPGMDMTSLPAGTDGLIAELQSTQLAVERLAEMMTDARIPSVVEPANWHRVEAAKDDVLGEELRVLARDVAEIKQQLSRLHVAQGVESDLLRRALAAKPEADRAAVTRLYDAIEAEPDHGKDWELRSIDAVVSRLGRPDELRPSKGELYLFYRLKERGHVTALVFRTAQGLVTTVFTE